MRGIFKIITAVLLCAALLSLTALPAATVQAASRSLKVLAIGNSFSSDAMEHLYGIAADCGADEIVLGNLYIGGCSLATHRSNADNNRAAYEYYKNTTGSWERRDNTTMQYGITDEAWDVITIQQVSGYSGLADTYNADIDSLISYIYANKTNSRAKIGWHMTWAYQSGSNHGDFPKYNNDQMTMYEAIVSAVESKILTNRFIDLVIPSGTAVQNVRSSYIGDTLTRDGYHLSYNLGRYIAAMTWLKTITGWSIDDVTYVPNSAEIPEEYLPVIKEAVNNAVTTPYSVTESSYKTKPEYDYSGYNLLDWQPTANAYWNSGDTNMHSTLVSSENSSASNLKYFVSSKRMFTKEDIPYGSVIVVDPGYQYRPEGWKELGRQTNREGNVSAERIVVNEDWWGDYTYRAFNVSALGSSTDISGIWEEAASHFRIFIPKSDEKAITSFRIGELEANISDFDITLTLPEGSDATALSPEIIISEKASVSPSSGEAVDFTNPVVYTVTAEDGSKAQYTVTISVPISVIPGDITSDGVVNVSDVVALRTFIMAETAPGEFQLKACDFNNDGSLNVSDVVALRTLIMNSQ